MSKYIKIEDTIFSLDDLKKHPLSYIPSLLKVFRISTIRQKSNESLEQTLTRLFNTCYSQKGLSYKAIEPINTETASLFSVLKQSAKNSTVRVLGSYNTITVSNDFLNEINIASLKKKCIDTLLQGVKIGVELEFIGDLRQISDFIKRMKETVGESRFEHKRGYNHNDGGKWILGTDSSVKPSRTNSNFYNQKGYELTSPILDPKNEHDMRELADVTFLVKNVFHGEVNRTCGTHVHFSFDCGMFDDKETVVKWLAHNYIKHETCVFDRAVSGYRRSDNNRFARPNDYRDIFISRYQKVNFTHCTTKSNRIHLEFRQLEGTLDHHLINAWISMHTFFVNNALNSYKKEEARFKQEQYHTHIFREPIEMVSFEDVVMGSEIYSHAFESLLLSSGIAKKVA